MWNQIESKCRVRDLQLATGGRYKPYLVQKCAELLKTNFLEERKKKLTLEEILSSVGETKIPDELKEWLIDTALPGHPRVTVLKKSEDDDRKNIKFKYQPPLHITGKAGLLKLLREKYEKPVYDEKDTAGLPRALVADSYFLANRIIRELLEEGKIIEISRTDRQTVLYYKKPDPDLDNCKVSSCFVELWRQADVSQKQMPHIREYLKKRGLPVFDHVGLKRMQDVPTANNGQGQNGKGGGGGKSDVVGTKRNSANRKKNNKGKVTQPQEKIGPKPKRKRRTGTSVFRDNQHIQGELITMDLDQDSSEQVGGDTSK